MLSVPIRNADGDVIGVAQAVNRISDVTESFDDQDERVSGHLNLLYLDGHRHLSAVCACEHLLVMIQHRLLSQVVSRSQSHVLAK